MQTGAIRVHEHGGPEVLRWESTELDAAGRGQVLLRQTAIGLNYIDVYFREGLYPTELPFVPGVEAVGTIESLEAPTPGFEVGQRVAYPFLLGAYSERRWVSSSELVEVPDGIDDTLVAATLLKGLTAYYLLEHTYPVRAGSIALVHAAAGGVGSLLSQWAKARGATVIGTAGGESKVRLALELGCDHAVDYLEEDFVEAVEILTEGRGVDVVYDGVGQATFDRSLACLREEGVMVSYGNASGPVPPVRPLDLAEKALYLTRPSLRTYLRRPGFAQAAARELFELLASGCLAPPSVTRRPLREAAAALRDLEERATVGSTVLIPGAQ